MVFLISGIFIRKSKAERAAERIKTLPDLVLADIRGGTFRTEQIRSGPLLITFFHPECDHCKYEISSLLNSGLRDSLITILLISNADRSEILTFLQQFEIDDTSTLHIVHDPEFRISDLFGADVMPSNFIYNDSLRLVRIYKGSTRPEALMSYLFSDDKQQKD
jgi:thiol-disulfide isomerase/thioredoxin